jgi:hypothetical protein
MNMGSRSVAPTFRKSRKVGQPIARQFRRKPKLGQPAPILSRFLRMGSTEKTRPSQTARRAGHPRYCCLRQSNPGHPPGDFWMRRPNGSYLNVVVPPFCPGTIACTMRFSKSQVKLRPWASASEFHCCQMLFAERATSVLLPSRRKPAK